MTTNTVIAIAEFIVSFLTIAAVVVLFAKTMSGSNAQVRALQRDILEMKGQLDEIKEQIGTDPHRDAQ